jgi:lipopolysaccharide export system protein LptA
MIFRMAPRNIPRSRRLACFLSLWLLAAPAAHAIKSAADEPIRINARSIESNQKTGVAVYRGNVLIEQGQLSIKADRVEIRMRNNRTDVIHATGKPAILHQLPDAASEEIRAEANQIDYHVSGRKIDMAGEVTLHHGEDLFTGGVLHYDLDARSLSATGGGESDDRVHAVIQPQKESPAPSIESNP